MQPRVNIKKLRSAEIDKEIAIARVARSANDGLAHALALNDLAWTLAINGVDLESNSPQRAQKDDECDPIAPYAAMKAQNAAKEALCGLAKMKTKDIKTYDAVH